MIAELELDGPPRDRRVASAGRRRGRRTRRAAVVAALALGAALLVPPASAESPARTVTSVGRSVTAADTGGGAALAPAHRSVRLTGRTAADHRVVTAAKAKKKKKGFFAKLGIFLLVVLILVVLFVVVLIALAIRLARRAFGRRRT
ncbi:hypothetical protein AB0H73_03645 [Streptomyces olivoreticuli]|uniref:hypothetical protein n=1 Tax=Streptomyces olivoreticuli TaxID=68246 RepID=UPI0013C37C13|nr:hypothetical protein [Streptomyces olivoreticuli]